MHVSKRVMQDPGYGFPRIPLMRSSVNKGKKGRPEPYFSARTRAFPSGEEKAYNY
jgi:hypothetical protein